MCFIKILYIALPNNMPLYRGARNFAGIMPLLCWTSTTSWMIRNLGIVHLVTPNWKLRFFWVCLIEDGVSTYYSIWKKQSLHEGNVYQRTCWAGLRPSKSWLTGHYFQPKQSRVDNLIVHAQIRIGTTHCGWLVSYTQILSGLNVVVLGGMLVLVQRRFGQKVKTILRENRVGFQRKSWVVWDTCCDGYGRSLQWRKCGSRKGFK